jgi:hypothetical protein
LLRTFHPPSTPRIALPSRFFNLLLLPHGCCVLSVNKQAQKELEQHDTNGAKLKIRRCECKQSKHSVSACREVTHESRAAGRAVQQHF